MTVRKGSKLLKGYSPSKGLLTHDPNSAGTYSPTGIWGDPTLATREKEGITVEGLLEGILKEIKQLRVESPRVPCLNSATSTAASQNTDAPFV